jgi:hypothetical protein
MVEPAWISDRSGRSIATENTEDTEIGEMDERTEQILGAAIEVDLNFRDRLQNLWVKREAK